MRLRKLLTALVLVVCVAVLGLLSAGLYLRHEYTQKTQWPTAAVRGPQAMVVSDEELADEAGIDILKEGGNAVDAAAAVGFALAVVEPAAGNIGGGGFMLVRLADGKTAFVDYREKAPLKASRNMYQLPDGSFDPDGSTIGFRAAGVPGTVAGLALAVRSYGKLPLAKILEPAIRLADAGFPVSQKLARSLEGSKDTLTRFPASKRIFLNGGAGFKAGEVLRQPELAATLRRIAANGADEFYKGDTARHLVDDMAKNGGLISLDDLAAYMPKIREALTANYRYRGHDWQVITSPPPSSGGVGIIEALNILDPIELRGWDDAQSIHWVAETMRRIFADRATWLADSDFTHVPVKGLTDPRYAAQLRTGIDPIRATPSNEMHGGDPGPFDTTLNQAGRVDGADDGAGEGVADGDRARNAGGCRVAKALSPAEAASWQAYEATRSGHTTHFSVVDADGNAVANTYTLNDGYGSAVTTTDGYLLNDEMDDFTAHPGQPNMFGLMQSEANTISPGKRPLSSMTPTILLRDGKLSFVTGSPGGPTIISTVLLTVLNWMRLGVSAQQAVNLPRFHHQWIPDELHIESGISLAAARELQARGYILDPPYWVRAAMRPPVQIGQVEAIGIDPDTGERLGAADARHQGVAIGY